MVTHTHIYHQQEGDLFDAMFEQSNLASQFKVELKELNRLKSELKANRETFGTDEQIKTALRRLERTIRDTETDLIPSIPSFFDKQVDQMRKKMFALKKCVEKERKNIESLSISIEEQANKIEKIRARTDTSKVSRLRAKCKMISEKLWIMRNLPKADHKYLQEIDLDSCLLSCAKLSSQAQRVHGIRMGNDVMKISTERLMVNALSAFRVKSRIVKYLSPSSKLHDLTYELKLDNAFVNNSQFKWPMGLSINDKNLAVIADNTDNCVHVLQLDSLGTWCSSCGLIPRENHSKMLQTQVRVL